MEITLPPKNDLSERIVLQNPHNIVIIGANGAGKSRFGEEIEREYPEQTFRISALNSVCIVPDSPDSPNSIARQFKEALDRSNLGLLKVGDKVNLERSMVMNGRLDGHIVQGHVDQTARCTAVEEADGSWYYTFVYDFDKKKAREGYMTVEKGSVTVNGVSLTVCNSKDDSFQVAIIPYTHEHTNFHQITVGSVVNLEFDIIGKYISRMMKYSD